MHILVDEMEPRACVVKASAKSIAAWRWLLPRRNGVIVHTKACEVFSPLDAMHAIRFGTLVLVRAVAFPMRW